MFLLVFLQNLGKIDKNHVFFSFLSKSCGKLKETSWFHGFFVQNLATKLKKPLCIQFFVSNLVLVLSPLVGLAPCQKLKAVRCVSRLAHRTHAGFTAGGSTRMGRPPNWWPYWVRRFIWVVLHANGNPLYTAGQSCPRKPPATWNWTPQQHLHRYHRTGCRHK